MIDRSSQMSERCAGADQTAPTNASAAAPRPSLTLVNTRFEILIPSEPAPDDWRTELEALTTWLGLDTELVPATARRGLSKVAGWSRGAAPDAPVFAPWLGWSPTGFQHGGLPSLPLADWTASYLFDQGPSGGVCRGVDIMLMSPLPSACRSDEAGGVPLPRVEVMRAMIRAAKAEDRQKLAVILHARQRNDVARQMMLADRTLTREGIALEIVTIEEALPSLMSGTARWDAMIVMPDLRSAVFTLLAETSGVRGAWPMLWYGGKGDNDLRLITCEAAGEGAGRARFDAAALVHALALRLRHSGKYHAARRLHEEWTRLRDSGVTTPSRGSSAPYVTEVSESAFVAMLCRGMAASRRPVHRWCALGIAKIAKSRNQFSRLRIISANASDYTN